MQSRLKWTGMKPEKEAELRCCAITFLKDRCVRLTTVTREGKKYCNMHDPVVVAAKQKVNKDRRHQGRPTRWA